MSATANKALGEAPISKLMLKFSIPCIVSLMVSALYNMVDQIFVGHGVGYLGNGATSVVYPITVITMAVSLMIGNGCAAHVSICQGKGDNDEATRAVGNAAFALIISSIVLVAVYYAFSEQIMWGFGATKKNIDYAREYYRYIVPGIPFLLISNALGAVIRADGSPKFALYSNLAGCVVNLILDPIAIFVLDWGMMGAAVATVIGQALVGIMSIWYLFNARTFTLKKQDFKPRAKTMGRIISLGTSSFMTQASLVLVMAAMNNTIVHYGAMTKFGPDIPLTSIGIVMKVFAIVNSVTVGVAIGIQPIVGYNFGAGKLDRVRELYKKMLITELLIGLVSLICFECFPTQIVSIFGKGNALYEEFAALTMRVYLSGIIAYCLQKGCSLFMLALGKPMLSSLLTMLREIVLHIPLILFMPMAFGLNGVLISAPASDIGSFIAAIIIATVVMKRLQKLEPVKKAN